MSLRRAITLQIIRGFLDYFSEGQVVKTNSGVRINLLGGRTLTELVEGDVDLLDLIRRERPDLMNWIFRIRKVSKYLDWEAIEDFMRALLERRFMKEFTSYTGIELGVEPINLSQKAREWIVKNVRNFIREVRGWGSS